jgi:glycosyltransferase involved in cell wall biosynthesis
MENTDKLRLTVWMNMPSPYQADFFRALARREEVELEVVFGRSLDPMRTDLGWTISNAGFVSQTLPTRWRTWQAIRWAWRRRDRVQVVNGVWALPEFTVAAAVLMLMGAPVFFHAEVPDPRVERSGVRQTVRNLLGKLLLRRSRGVFAISGLAERFYARLLGENGRVFPFGYFKDHEFAADRAAKLSPREVLFVGQLIERKAVELLVEAFAGVAAEFPQVRLALIGAGLQEESLRAQISRLKLEGRVFLEGTVNSAAIDARIRQAAVLVLPSHFDGWGLVVNEALAGGVPVIVSEACGAADLVRGSSEGIVVPAGDQAALQSALRQMLRAPEKFRVDAKVWAGRIGLGPVADYFLGCLRYGLGLSAVKPRPCWRKDDLNAEVTKIAE